ncbi:MAG TPA: metal-dependent transcriptional regulator [Candidatus Bathyarchaeia archaeon]
MSGKSVENYLKALYVLCENGKAVSTTAVSHHLRVAPGSVTEMLQKLAEKGYIEYSPYHGSKLTSKGLQVAEIVTRKHRLLEKFLHDVLKIGKDKVHTQACEMEHALSDEAEESLCRLLNHPDKCPDDENLIPACSLPFSNCEDCIMTHSKGLEEVGKREQHLVSISNLKEGKQGKVSFVRGEHKTLQRLLDMGLTPGTNVRILRVAPLNGPTEIGVRGTKIALGQDIASNVFIEVSKQKQD